MEIDLKVLKEFSLECQQSDLSKGTVMTKDIGHIMGIDIILRYEQGKYGLTEAEEKALEISIGKRWDAAHSGKPIWIDTGSQPAEKK